LSSKILVPTPACETSNEASAGEIPGGGLRTFSDFCAIRRHHANFCTLD
jgi:hypothetical protein